MRGMVLNELNIVHSAVVDNVLIDSDLNTINALIKYYIKLGETDIVGITEKISVTMEQCSSGYVRANYKEYIEKKSKAVIKSYKKYGNDALELIQVDKVVITKKELEEIDAINDKKIRKLAFVILIYAKLQLIINPNSKGWLNTTSSNIIKEAKINGKLTDNLFLMHELYKSEYIYVPINAKKTSIRCDYIYEDSEVAIEITEFNEPIHYYYMHLGQKWKKCLECGKWIKVRTKTKPQKYCKDCRRKMDAKISAKAYHNNK